MGKEYKSLREILEEYLPSIDIDYDLLKLAMERLGRERTVAAFKEVFNGWTKREIT